MKKYKSLIIVPLLLIFVMMFGAWTYQPDTEERYADAPLLSAYANETINYTKKEITLNSATPGNCPCYYPTSDLSNACGAVAGAEIAAFYDKYYPNLVPNWTSYYTSSGKYRIQDATNVPTLIRQMYTIMRTNVDDVGVSQTDFLNGLRSYVNNNGYQINYQNVKSGSTVDFNQCINAVDSNKVIVLFIPATNVYSVVENSNLDIVTSTNISGGHIMVAYGYYQIKYYNASGVFRTDTYLRVAVGQTSLSTALFKINSTALNAAYIVNIN